MIELWYCDTFDVPTQLPTHGQWWSNLAMQRLHTAQCLDLMGFRICKVKKKGAVRTHRSNIFCADRRFLPESESLPSRCCRICSDPGCPSLPAPRSSGGRKPDNKAKITKKDQRHGRKKNEWTTEKLIFLRSIWHRNKRSTDGAQAEAGWVFQLTDYTGGQAHSLWTGTKALLGLFTVSFTH